MPGKQGMLVREYLRQLKETKKGKPSQIRDALEIYIELWDDVIKKGTVSEDDEVGLALAKLDKAGGLQQAASQGQ